MTVWLTRPLVVAIHDVQLARYGGAAGLRDGDLLESALARPLNRAAYGAPDIAELAGLYACAIARNHPFVDGNKRTAFAAMVVFLALNGVPLQASEVDAVLTTLRMAAGDLDEDGYLAWVRANLPEPA